MKPEADDKQQCERPQTRSRKFVKDLGIYAIGNLGSKLITFLLIPFYTYYITNPADFGYYDLCVNTMFCLIPIIGLQVNEGAFRFLMEDDAIQQHRKVVSYVYTLLIRNSALALVVGVVLWHILDVKYLMLTLCFGLVQTIYDVQLQIVRGMHHTKMFVSAGIMNTFMVAVFSILFVALLGQGIPGVFWANILARSLVVIIVDRRLGILGRYYSPKYIDKQLGRQLLRYSLPLIPAALCWWFLSNNNYYFLKYYTDLTQTGLYGIMNRFTGILYILAFIFYQTWQQNALEQYQSADKDRFFSSIFNNYFYLLSFLIVLFPFALRLNYSWLVSEEYRPSAQYMYLNSIYIMLFALSQFFELGYQCSKHTRRILPSLVIAIIVIVVGNFLLVPRMGIYGVVTASILTWGAMLAYRAIDTRKYMKIKFNSLNYKLVIIVIAGAIVYHFYDSALVDLASMFVAALIFLFLVPADVKAHMRRARH